MQARKWLAIVGGSAAATYATYVATTWLHYGRPRPARGHMIDPLLDQFMREHDVVERTEIRVDAPPEVAFAAAKHVSFDSSRIIRAIFRAREMILRAEPARTRSALGESIVDQMSSIGWAILAETPTELVFGAVTQPWQATPVFRPLQLADFVAFAEPDHVKIVWTLRVDPADDGGSLVRTETRAVATDDAARRKFRLYWALLSPGIILIRAVLLPIIKRDAERRCHSEGDPITFTQPARGRAYRRRPSAPPGRRSASP